MNTLRTGLAASAIVAAAACGGHSHGRDHGAPSDVYPAPHAALPQVYTSGGPVQSAPVFVSVTWPGDPFAPLLDDFTSRMGTTQYWADAGNEYGIGTGTSGIAHVLTPAPIAITDSALEAWLVGMLDGSHPEFGTPTINSLYLLYTPKETVIGGVDTSCIDYYAYHAFVTLPGGARIPYALVPRCDGYAGISDLDSATEAAAHEMIEAASDPLVLDTPAWADTDAPNATWDYISNGGELGDMCEWQDAHDVRPADLPYVIQRSWSNARAAASHDPCVPVDATIPYYNAAPVLPDDVSVPVADIGPVTGKGLVIHVGESKTIEVDLFSDAPTAPFLLSAVDDATLYGQPAELSFTFDKASGVNGEKSYLTVHVLRAGAFKAGQSLFFIESTLDGHTQYWPVLVSNNG